MTKKHITITIDDEIWFQLRHQDLNISSEVNDFLKARLKIGDITEKEILLKKLSEIRQEIKQRQYDEQAVNNKLNQIKKQQDKKTDDEVNSTLDAIRASGILTK